MVLPEGGVYIVDDQDIILQQVYVRNAAPGASPPQNGITILNSWVQANDLDVVGADCGTEPNFFPRAGAGLHVGQNSIVALCRPKIQGGFGGGPWDVSPATPDGGPAISVNNSIVTIIDDATNLNYIVGGQGGTRGAASATSIPSGNGGNAMELDMVGFAINKKPMALFPGAAGLNNAIGGALGSSGAPVVTNNGSVYMPINDNPALFNITGSTGPGGTLALQLQSASPGLTVGMGVMQEFDLGVFPPALQFGGGKPPSLIFIFLGTSDATGVLTFFFTLPNPLAEFSGVAMAVQGTDVVNNQLFLSNPSVSVGGF
jgi:hypothetical protein